MKQICPDCAETVTWDEAHFPPAWRHEHDSRWCDLDAYPTPDGLPHYPAGATDRTRASGQTNAELWV